MLEIEVDHCHTVTVDLYSNEFMSRWKLLFEKTAASCGIDQLEAFSCNLTEVQAQERLLWAIDTINGFLKRTFIETGDIDWNDQDWYNYLHAKFERLSGSYDRPTRLMTLADTKLRSAVRALNFYVHKLEQRPYGRHRPWYISFDKDCYQRLPLQPKDYELFQGQVHPGEVVVHYAELGKTTVDLYEDGLPKDYPGLKNLHYYSAELSAHLGSETISFFSEDFRKWAEENSIDIYDRTLGLGVIPIGTIRDLDRARQIVYNGSSITNLRIS